MLQIKQGVKHCEERNASIAEIFGGVRAGDERFDVSEQFHHVFWMGAFNLLLLVACPFSILSRCLISHFESFLCPNFKFLQVI